MVKALADRLAEVSILSESSMYTSNLLSYSCSLQLKLYFSYAIDRALISISIYLIALIHDFRHLNARTLNDGMIAWSHGLLGANTSKVASEYMTR